MRGQFYPCAMTGVQVTVLYSYWNKCYCFLWVLCVVFLWVLWVVFLLSLPVFHEYLEPNRCLCLEIEFCYVNDFDVCDGCICPGQPQTQGLCSVTYRSCQLACCQPHVTVLSMLAFVSCVLLIVLSCLVCNCCWLVVCIVVVLLYCCSCLVCNCC